MDPSMETSIENLSGFPTLLVDFKSPFFLWMADLGTLVAKHQLRGRETTTNKTDLTTTQPGSNARRFTHVEDKHTSSRRSMPVCLATPSVRLVDPRGVSELSALCRTPGDTSNSCPAACSTRTICHPRVLEWHQRVSRRRSHERYSSTQTCSSHTIVVHR